MAPGCSIPRGLPGFGSGVSPDAWWGARPPPADTARSHASGLSASPPAGARPSAGSRGRCSKPKNGVAENLGCSRWCRQSCQGDAAARGGKPPGVGDAGTGLRGDVLEAQPRASPALLLFGGTLGCGRGHLLLPILGCGRGHLLLPRGVVAGVQPRRASLRGRSGSLERLRSSQGREGGRAEGNRGDAHQEGQFQRWETQMRRAVWWQFPGGLDKPVSSPVPRCAMGTTASGWQTP